DVERAARCEGGGVTHRRNCNHRAVKASAGFSSDRFEPGSDCWTVLQSPRCSLVRVSISLCLDDNRVPGYETCSLLPVTTPREVSMKKSMRNTLLAAIGGVLTGMMPVSAHADS